MAYLTSATMAAFTHLWAPYHTPEMAIFGICAREVSQRIQAEAWEPLFMLAAYASSAGAGQNAVASLVET